MNNDKIIAAVEELKQRRQDIDTSIELLERLYNPPGTAPARNCGGGGQPLKAKRKWTRRTPIGRNIAGLRKPRAGTVGVAVCAPMIRGLKEPFTTADVQRACKVDKKKASNLVTGLKLKGWIELAGETNGHFKRTKDFGGVQLADIHAEIAAAKPKTEN